MSHMALGCDDADGDG